MKMTSTICRTIQPPELRSLLADHLFQSPYLGLICLDFSPLMQWLKERQMMNEAVDYLDALVQEEPVIKQFLQLEQDLILFLQQSTHEEDQLRVEVQRLLTKIENELFRLFEPCVEGNVRQPLFYTAFNVIRTDHLTDERLFDALRVLWKSVVPISGLRTEKELFYHTLQNRNIHTFFQPIFNMDSLTIYGFEALTRGPQNSSLYPPNRLFSLATEENSLYDLEKIAREKAIDLAHSFLKRDEKLFINISAEVIYDSEFTAGYTRNLLETYQISPHQIVFEITERSAIIDYEAFTKVLQHYRQQSFQIAIDDAGAGYSSLQAITELQPEYIKIDRSLIRDIHINPLKQQLLHMFVQIADQTDSAIIAEGIEQTEELEALQQLGVHLGQGFLLGKPQYPVLRNSDEGLELG